MKIDDKYPLLVETLLSEKRYIDSFNNEIEIRPIPDNDKRGVLDPREYNLALETLKNRINTPKTIEAIRKETGFPNKNLNTIQMEMNVFYVKVKNRNIRVFEYYPRDLKDANSIRSAFVYVHGGSWFAGSPFISENTCRYIAELMNCYVFNIDISLCPENPFPAAIEDVNGVLEYLFLNHSSFNIDPNKIIGIGDSSGANLILESIQLGLSFNLYAQVLYYPSISMDIDHLPFEWKESDYEIDETYKPFIIPRLCLGRSDGKGDMKLMELIYNLYLQHGEERNNPLVSPLNSNLKLNPRTLIFTAEFDGLRIQDEYFAFKLKESGIECKTIRFNGVHHGFIDKFGVFPQGEASLKLMKEWLNG